MSKGLVEKSEQRSDWTGTTSKPNKLLVPVKIDIWIFTIYDKSTGGVSAVGFLYRKNSPFKLIQR